MALAPPGETIRPSYSKTPSQTKETKCQILVEQAQQQNETSDLPRPDSGHSPQGWLLHRVLPPLLAAEGALPLPSSEGAAERRCLNLHNPFGHHRRNIDRPIRLGFISDWH
jgi:hypothetical protein